MRVYVAYTGGTIGMVPSDQGYIPDAAFADVVLQKLSQYSAEHEFFVHCYPELIDSSNAAPSDWVAIANDLQARWQDYDAFMVLHGTDTMAYTSSALAFMFQNPTKPVIVTGSQIPMFKSRNDALDNVYGALDALLEGPNGVFLFFGGKLIEGARAHKANTSALQAFSSPNALLRGELGIEWNWRKMHTKKGESIQIPHMQNDAVTLIPIFPGLQAAQIESLLFPQGKEGQIKGAVLLTYGAGNGPDANPEFLALLKKASDSGCAIVNVSQCGAGAVSAGTYAAGSALVQAGVISALDMTYEAAFAKLHFLIGLGKSAVQIRAEFDQALAYDVSH